MIFYSEFITKTVYRLSNDQFLIIFSPFGYSIICIHFIWQALSFDSCRSITIFSVRINYKKWWRSSKLNRFTEKSIKIILNRIAPIWNMNKKQLHCDHFTGRNQFESRQTRCTNDMMTLLFWMQLNSVQIVYLIN